MNVKELFDQCDYLVSEPSGLSLYPQWYDDEDHCSVEYDDGSLYAEWEPETLVEPTSHGTVLVLGTEYRAYVAQQIKFNPDQE